MALRPAQGCGESWPGAQRRDDELEKSDRTTTNVNRRQNGQTEATLEAQAGKFGVALGISPQDPTGLSLLVDIGGVHWVPRSNGRVFDRSIGVYSCSPKPVLV